MQSMLIVIFYIKLFNLLETFKRSINTCNSQTEPRKIKVLEILKQNIYAKITL